MLYPPSTEWIYASLPFILILMTIPAEFSVVCAHLCMFVRVTLSAPGILRIRFVGYHYFAFISKSKHIRLLPVVCAQVPVSIHRCSSVFVCARGR
ncbi:hypothetical protein EV424DRAFT_1453960 [Suillus variegatus]|nr:hypothetical protein EV424DRAFT_1453960 [Suillus variegatus]